MPPGRSRAASWAAASTPRANPETTAIPTEERSRPSLEATSRPYGVAAREPTTAMAGSRRRSSEPSAKRTKGGSGISMRGGGNSASNAVTILTPRRSTSSAQRSARGSSADRSTRAGPRGGAQRARRALLRRREERLEAPLLLEQRPEALRGQVPAPRPGERGASGERVPHPLTLHSGVPATSKTNGRPR